MGYFTLLLLHIGIAFLIYLYRPFSLFYFISTFFYFSFLILRNGNRNNEALMAAAYLAGAEIFLRMTGGSVFYETGKYGVIYFLTLGMCFKGFSPKAGLFSVYLLLLFPGVLIASQSLNYNETFRKILAFNLSGPVCLAVCAIYCYYKKINRLHFEKVLLMLLLPITVHMTYLYLYTPSLVGIELNTASNWDASGGFGPNQVSTIMGMGSFLLIIRFLILNNKIGNIVDLVLLGLMTYRAIATFSRGGVVTFVLATLVLALLLFFRYNCRERKRLSIKAIFLMGILLISWVFTSFQTSGLVLNRYANKDLSGNYKEDFTTGRIDLLATELVTFSLNPLVGVGVGKAADLREKEFGRQVATHNEFSRLLAEHGLLGFVSILILLLAPFLFYIKFRNNPYSLAFVSFWFLTSSHSAIRMALPALVYGLALLYIVDEKKDTLHR